MGSWGEDRDGVRSWACWGVGSGSECLVGDWKANIAALTTPLAHIFAGIGGVAGGWYVDDVVLA